MKPRLPKEPRAEAPPGPSRREGSRVGHRLRAAVESGVLAGLLLGAVGAVMAGSGLALFFVVTTAWLALTVIVGPQNVLDAGCVFMLITVGIVLVVDLATNGPASLLH